MIAVALINSGLDYWNSLLSGISNHLFDRLQVIQNAAAKVVTSSTHRTHTAPLLQSLHWLPVRSRVSHKMGQIVYKLRAHSQPTYLSELISDYTPSRSLRSTSHGLLTVPRFLRICRREPFVPVPHLCGIICLCVLNQLKI